MWVIVRQKKVTDLKTDCASECWIWVHVLFFDFTVKAVVIVAYLVKKTRCCMTSNAEKDITAKKEFGFVEGDSAVTVHLF